MPGPFTKNFTRTIPFGVAQTLILDESLNQTWYTSLKVDGKLDKRPQPFSRLKRKLWSASQHNGQQGFYVVPLFLEGVTAGDVGPIATAMRQQCYNQAYSRFWKQVKGDDTAGLAINFLQWRQTWSMITRSQDRVFSLMKDAAVESRRRGKAGKPLQRERFADLFLEKQFGWAPLMSDIWIGLKYLSGWNAETLPLWYRGSAVAFGQIPDSSPDPYKRYVNRQIHVRTTISARAEVSNPNLWIANQLGLVNPFAVAWDRIPWSFLVGMFANVNSWMASFTNHLGLTLTDGNTTYTTRVHGTTWVSNTYPTSHPFWAMGTATGEEKLKTRVLSGGSLPRPQLQVVLPKLEWGLALTGSALAYQQLSKLGPKVPGVLDTLDRLVRRAP